MSWFSDFWKWDNTSEFYREQEKMMSEIRRIRQQLKRERLTKKAKRYNAIIWMKARRNS